jgi:hypothetical protein
VAFQGWLCRPGAVGDFYRRGEFFGIFLYKVSC